MPITHPAIYRFKNQMNVRTWNQTKNDLNNGVILDGTVIYRYNLEKRGIVNNEGIIIWDDNI